MAFFLRSLLHRRAPCSLPMVSRNPILNRPENPGTTSFSAQCFFENGGNSPGASRADEPKWTNKATRKKDGPFAPSVIAPVVEVSPEMRLFIERLQKHGYLKEDTFGKDDGPSDPCRLRVYGHSMGFLKNAVDRFGREHQEIAKWLSGKHLKEVALLGCPSTDRKTVYAAKRLRSFFSIQEDTVCKTCPLKKSCKFSNKRARRDDKLILLDPLLVLIGYALQNPTPSRKYMLSDETKFSISKILKEAVNLSFRL